MPGHEVRLTAHAPCEEVDHHGGQSGRIEGSVNRIEEILGHAVRR